MLTGRVYDAPRASHRRLAVCVVGAGEGLPKAMALAERIAVNAPLSISL